MIDALPRSSFRDTQPIRTNRSDSPLRLVSPLIVALLAITMAIFPISVPSAAVLAGHGHVVATTAGHDNAHEHADLDGGHQHIDQLMSADDTTLGASTDHGQESRDCPGLMCCSMGVCHAFQASEPPSLHAPAVSQAAMAMAFDEQVGGIAVGGLDRPPRTV